MNKSSADVNPAWHDWMCHVPLETHTTMASDRQKKKNLVDFQQQLWLAQIGTGQK